LEEGEFLAVVGKGKWKAKNEINLDIPKTKVLIIGPDTDQPVYFTDDSNITAHSEGFFY
jgi:hypothetical protein